MAVAAGGAQVSPRAMDTVRPGPCMTDLQLGTTILGGHEIPPERRKLARTVKSPTG